MKTKIALCLHGYFDSRMDPTSKGNDGYEHIKKHILECEDCEVDVYIHSWQPELYDRITSLYKPKAAEFEIQKDFSKEVISLGLDNMPGDSPTGRSPHTILSHLYSVSKSFNLIEDINQYDLVIKARFDLGRINRNTSGPGKQNPYPVQCINFDPNIREGLCMANWQYIDGEGPADMWFYGPPKIMSKFKTLYSYVEKSMKPNKVNVIMLLKEWMESVGIWDQKVLLKTEWE